MRRSSYSGLLLLALLVSASAQAQSGSRDSIWVGKGKETKASAMMVGKVDTGRTIHFEVVVPAPAAEVFRLWTTPEGVKEFFAPQARIEPWVGGQYEIIFQPQLDPEGENYGTKGAQILRLEENRLLVFEWITFVFDKLPGVSGPPQVSRAERDARPLPTWVEVSFEPVEEEPSKTRIRLAHRGFRKSEKWKEAFAYFWPIWGTILGQMGAYFGVTASY